VEADMIRTPADVFHLEPAPLLELERWGEKSVLNLMAQLEERRAVPFDRFLVSLAIPEVGSATARLLARHFSTLADLQAADEEQLVQLEGIGPEMAKAILQFFAAGEARQLIERLLAGGVRIVFPDPAQQASGELADKTIVFTGTLAGLSRAEAKRLAEGAGAKVTSAVSAKTDFVVTGAAAGSKRKKAEELGVSILDEEGFLGLVGR
jgi:DNA ligase (NAD+)